jgi:hypothetical protein
VDVAPLLPLLAALTVALCATATPASASPGSPLTAAVALGDSFIAGEGGRWLGNSSDPRGDRNGTDRAAYDCGLLGCSFDPIRIYGASEANGCHRSDTAPIESGTIAVSRRVNLACSGARTANLRSAAQGGAEHRSEAPQVDRLARLARRLEVRLVVVTAGANDLGFGRLVLGCVASWLTTPASDPRPCAARAQASLEAAASAAREGLLGALADVRAAMRRAGYGPSDYRLMVGGYASPLPPGGSLRYPQGGWSRLHTGGCPVWDADADWAAGSATELINGMLSAAAARRGAEFLDVSRILAGHELCHRDAARVTDDAPPRARTSEWVRALAPGQGSLREALHPNAYGQRAIGRCIGLAYAAGRGDWSCRRRGAGIRSAYLAPGG